MSSPRSVKPLHLIVYLLCLVASDKRPQDRATTMQEEQEFDIWDEDPYQMNVIEPLRDSYEWFDLETKYANAD